MFEAARVSKPSSSYSSGNTIKLIRGGAEYFDTLERIITAARHIIHFQVYIFDSDETGIRIANALKEAAVRGVHVYLMLDSYASKNLSKAFIQELKKAGINFRYFHPVLKSKKFYLGRRLHHKVIAVDNRHSLVAGLNISNRYNDTDKAPAWLDWSLYSEGPIAESLTRICMRRFKLRSANHIDVKDVKPFILAGSEKNCSVRARMNDWVSRKREITKSYLEMFRTSKSHIIIMSPYFLPGVVFRRTIRQAVRRGVKIKLILAGESDIPLSKSAERYLYRWLFKNNIEVFEYQKNVLHGKMAVCDAKWMTVGSYNLNNLSAYASVELNLDVDNEVVAKHAQKLMMQIIEQDCEQITQDEYDRAGWVKHVMEKIAYNIFQLLSIFFTRRRE